MPLSLGELFLTRSELFRGVEVWLVDEGLESSLPDGAVLATRLYIPERFAMTAGVLVPLDLELMEDAIADTPQLLRKGYEEAIDDRRFAEAIYRVALASGFMELVGYRDTIAEIWVTLLRISRCNIMPRRLSQVGSIATGRGKLEVQPCPQCPVSDGRPEKGGLS